MKTRSLLFASLLILGACTTKSKNEAALQEVKKIAIVAFAVDQPAPAGIGLNLNSGKIGATANGDPMAKYSPHADKIFASLAKSFTKQTKIQVIDMNQMTSNAGYISAYKKTMEGWQNKMPLGEGMKQFTAKSVMDADGTRILDTDGREALQKSLGVDGIMEAKVQIILSGSTVMGVGSRYPQALLSFKLYRNNEAAPIWFEGKIEGDPSTESVGKTHFFDEKRLIELAEKVAVSAFDRINTETL